MKRLIIEKPGKIGFTEFKLENLGETQALARTLYSGLSHGTEMHAYRGLDGGSYPCGTGYSNVGEIIEVGKNVNNLSIGDLIFAYSGHATHFVVDEANPLKLPTGLTPQAGVFLARTLSKSTMMKQTVVDGIEWIRTRGIKMRDIMVTYMVLAYRSHTDVKELELI